jgi:hypothetical protein
MTKLWIGCLVVLTCFPSSAKTPMFPANHESVLVENAYADDAGLKRYSNMAEVQQDESIGVLMPIDVAVSPKLPANRRLLRKSSLVFLNELDARFRAETGHGVTVDSAVRPADVQKRLTHRCRAAAPANGARASTHERGTTFDLSRRMKRGEYRLLLVWLAYYQAAGRIHVIEERSCVHVMVREDLWMSN